MQMLESERAVAEWVCNNYVKAIIDEHYGLTMGGLTLAERLMEKWHVQPPVSVSASVAADAVRHWVIAAGYDSNEEYTYRLSKHRIG